MCDNHDKATATTDSGVTVAVTSVVNDAEQLDAMRNCEFIVVTKLAGCHFDHFATVLDGMLGGYLSKVADGWNADYGTYRLIYLPAVRSLVTDEPVYDVDTMPASFGKMKYVLLFGLGAPRDFKRKGLCAFTGFTLTTAARCGAKKITYLESPHRSTEDSVSLAGTAAIMQCRMRLLKEGSYMRELDTLEYIARPQAKPHLLAGLDARVPACRACSWPEVNA